MNAIRQTQLLNKRELENAIPPSASWHADYRDTAYIYVGGLPLDVSEGDVVTIFSQYGNPTHINMIRDRETGKSKGFAFLKYEDQRSCDLAVDNLGGAEVLGRMLRVDHTRYKKRDDEDEDTHRIDKAETGADSGMGKRASDTDESGDETKRRPLLKEERELEEMLQIKEGEEEDPMREYLIQEKRDELERAKEREKKHRNRQRHNEEGERKHPHRRYHGDRDAERRRRHRGRDREGERDSRPHRHRRERS